MFVQVFQGHVTDAGQVRQALDDWMERLAPDAEGWLGSTGGVIDDGTFVGVARFASAEAAQRNSGRALQGEWWSGLSKLFSGEAEFHDCSEVDTARGGGSDQAGFVQVIQGRATDVARLRELTSAFDQRFPDLRPDLLGFTSALHNGEEGAFTQVAYFTSEAEARGGEKGEMPADAAEALREEMELMQDVRYLDLREPWLFSPR
ncbi:MAG: hypothetical protein ACRDQ0_11115 [Pseudonocardia sp.]